MIHSAQAFLSVIPEGNLRFTMPIQPSHTSPYTA